MSQEIDDLIDFKTCAKVVLYCGVAASLPAVYGLLSTVYHAIADGAVMVFSIGRFETSRSVVPWPQAWARFLGFSMLASCGVVWLGSKDRTRQWWFAAALSALGFPLVMFSQWFTTLRGTLILSSIASVVALAYSIDRKYGRFASASLLALVVAFLVWRYEVLNF